MIYFSGTPLIETERLILRKLEMSDVQKVYDHWLSDERVSDNRVSAPHQNISETVERMAEIVGNYAKKDFCWWGIELKTDYDLIGEIDLYNFDKDTENCEVSYSLGYNWWNQGYGTEALKAVVEFSFRYMNVHKISAAHNIDNPASGKVMRKAGMEKEVIIKHMIRNAKKEYKDCAVYGILQTDYLRENVNAPTSILKLEMDITINLEEDN
ncbi:GNAT family N-acetyltransferase [Gracilibacillus oryzae]|uniref:GNAT family N-acetyltransferase n=1 Tax=Gracilibacillus oryzae TaxID=1672701 RepID=A0A7C8GTY4_9BACI|nr:GNAT family N-acetyltransferase [Gracilibacillus oryzae]KAB8135747.1 GNAT family N-acetyltransferase [Gracilibacillus oryzae]